MRIALSGVEFVILGLASKSKYFQTYTSWNWLLILSRTFIGISPAPLLINSITTWVGFQYGATDGTKYRLMKQNKIKSVSSFLLYDIIARLVPVLGLGYVVVSNKMKINTKDILRQSSWAAFYYCFVIKGFNAEKQYVKYPYYRQVFQAFTTPLVSMSIINSYNDDNHIPLVVYLSYLWYGKDYFDISDYRHGK